MAGSSTRHRMSLALSPVQSLLEETKITKRRRQAEVQEAREQLFRELSSHLSSLLFIFLPQLPLPLLYPGPF